MAATDYIRFFDGFDGQMLGRFESSSGGTVELSVVSLSRAAWRWNVAAATGYARILGEGPAADGTWIDNNNPEMFSLSFHLYITTLPGGANIYSLVSWTDATIERGRVYLNSSGNVVLYHESVGTYTGTVALATGTWYVVSVINGSGGLLRVVVRNRDSNATVDTVSSTANGVEGGRQIYLGPSVTSTGNCVFDNFVMSGSNVAANIDDLVNILTPKYAVGTLVPVATGAWDAASGTWADVDEIPPDADTTYRLISGAAAANKAFTQTFQNTAGLAAAVGTIYGLAVTPSMRAEVAFQTASIRMRTGGTDYDSSGATDLPAALPYSVRHKTWLTNPFTASRWQSSDADSVQGGCIRTPTSTGNVRCTSVYVDVLYSTTSISRTRQIHYYRKPDDPTQRIMDYKGRNVPYNELRPNRWMRRVTGPPRGDSPASFWQWRDLTLIEGVVWTQDESGMSVEIRGSKDDFVDSLIRRISDSSGGL